jgi:hypothetical protein
LRAGAPHTTLPTGVWSMKEPLSRDLRRASGILVTAAAAMIAVGVLGVIASGTDDVSVVEARLPQEPGLGDAVAAVLTLQIDMLGALAGSSAAHDGAKRDEERRAAGQRARERDAEAWRSFHEQPPQGALGARVAALCASPDPPDPSRCIADAHDVLRALRQERARRRSRFASVAWMGVVAVVVAAVMGALARRTKMA